MDISIESAEIKFTEHIKHPNNNRILFSGKFGTGKSYFLKKYFGNNEEIYNLFWLTPVDYVVGANQDIFEWIKTDIAKEVFKKDGFSKQKEKFSKNLLIQTYIHENSSSIFTTLVSVIANETAKLKSGFDFLHTFKKHISEFENFSRQIKNNGKSDEEKIKSHLNNAIQIKGSVYEDDLTTQIIRASVELLKANTKKANVLVIDDLDRLDPEHIFRILNILSTHNNHFETNKFGFDKVILVCDYNNIKHIYEYKYGEKVDFHGYIEKFYTYEPFYFTIYDAIVNYCTNSYTVTALNESARYTLVYILSLLYERKILRVRNLKKIVSEISLMNEVSFPKIIFQSKYNGHKKDVITEFSKTDTFEIDLNDHQILKVVWLLSTAFGGIDNLYNSFKELTTNMSGDIDEFYISHIAETTIITHLIASNQGNIERVFFLWKKDTYGTHEHLETHNLGFLSNLYSIFPQWTSNNKYISDDYFKNRKINCQSTSSRGNSKSELFKLLMQIIDYIRYKKLFSNLNV